MAPWRQILNYRLLSVCSAKQTFTCKLVGFESIGGVGVLELRRRIC